MAFNFTHKINKFTSAGTPIEVRLEVTGLGTPTFRFEIVFEFYSCEVHYDIMGNRTIQPLADHYEPNEIEDWHKDILEDISDHYNNNKDEYFNLLVGKINEAYAKIERTTNVLVKKINEDYSE